MNSEKVQVYVGYCVKCRKHWEVWAKDGYLTDKTVQVIYCPSNHKIPVDSLVRKGQEITDKLVNISYFCR